MTEEPAPCPFCGGKSEAGETLDYEWYVLCGKCETMSGNQFPSRSEAIAAWNRRATPAVRDGLVERLLKAANDFEGCRFNHANHEESDCEPHWSCQEEMEDAAKVAREAADALSLRPAETRVKPLEWRPIANSSMLAGYIGDAHHYTLLCHSDGTVLASGIEGTDVVPPTFASIEAAKSAAQSDFEKRIKASISEPARAEEGKAEPVASRLIVTDDAVEAAAGAFDDYGISFALPWQSTLDDLEDERYRALRAALEASLPFLSQTGGWRAEP